MEKLSALLYFLLLLFINGTQSRKDPPKSSSSCGDSLVISYPFRLKDDPVTCGDPNFQLHCQNNKTIMNFHGGLYYVKGISYDDHTIQLADMNLANGSCSLPYRSLTMGEIQNDARYSGSFNYSYSYTLNYVRCWDNTSGLVDSYDSRVPCLTRNSSHVYVNATLFGLTSDDIPKTCKVIATAQSFYDQQLPEKPSYATALKMQGLGFRMRWSVECRDCMAKGRGCVYRSADSFLFKCESTEYGMASHNTKHATDGLVNLHCAIDMVNDPTELSLKRRRGKGSRCSTEPFYLIDDVDFLKHCAANFSVTPDNPVHALDDASIDDDSFNPFRINKGKGIQMSESHEDLLSMQYQEMFNRINRMLISKLTRKLNEANAKVDFFKTVQEEWANFKSIEQLKNEIEYHKK